MRRVPLLARVARQAVLVGLDRPAALRAPASSSSRAISRSPSTRAGWSGGRPATRFWIRLRIWSAKWGVEAPISWRTSSTVGSRTARSGRSYSLTRRRGYPASGRGRLDRDQLGDPVEPRLGAERDRRRRRRGSRRGCRRPGRGRPRSRAGRSGSSSRARGGRSAAWSVSSSGANTPRRGERRRGGGVERPRGAGHREVVARDLHAPAEVALAVAGERDRVLDRRGPLDAVDRAGEPFSSWADDLASTSTRSGPST